MTNRNASVSVAIAMLEYDLISTACGDEVADMYMLYKENHNLNFLSDALELSREEVKEGIAAAKAALEDSDIDSLIADLVATFNDNRDAA